MPLTAKQEKVVWNLVVETMDLELEIVIERFGSLDEYRSFVIKAVNNAIDESEFQDDFTGTCVDLVYEFF